MSRGRFDFDAVLHSAIQITNPKVEEKLVVLETY